MGVITPLRPTSPNNAYSAYVSGIFLPPIPKPFGPDPKPRRLIRRPGIATFNSAIVSGLIARPFGLDGLLDG